MSAVPKTQPDIQTRAEDWFRSLRDDLCAAFEALEDEAANGPAGNLSPGRFERTDWDRGGDNNAPNATGSILNGGGEISLMRGGRVFEKAGVNISIVHGTFSESFRKEIPGATESGGKFRAAGISLVMHPRSPHVPIVHMNTRIVATSQSWFGGGADLTPVFPDAQDTADFHTALKNACDAYRPGAYAEYKAWCDKYFFLPHRNEPRGVGGIFYDYIDSGSPEADFTFTRSVGQAFAGIYPEIVRRHISKPWTPEDREAQRRKRGRYVEFNLLHDRGTRFGLQTGGNTEAILMSLPPDAGW